MIDAATERWGVEVTMVEIKDVELPEQRRRAMAREASTTSAAGHLIQLPARHPDDRVIPDHYGHL